MLVVYRSMDYQESWYMTPTQTILICTFLLWKILANKVLVGDFNPVEKYESKWIISPNRDEDEKMFETTT